MWRRWRRPKGVFPSHDGPNPHRLHFVGWNGGLTVKKRPFLVVFRRMSKLPIRWSFVYALLALGPGQPWPILAAERMVLCEEFTNDT